MALSLSELKALVLPELLLKKEIYDKTPGWRIRHEEYNFFNLVSQVIAASSGSIQMATLTDNGNGTYTYTPVTGSAVLIDTRANSNPVDTTATQVPTTINTTQKAVEDLYHFMNNVKALFGVTWTNGTTNPTMGTYTGWTISDNQTVKQNIQELELAVQDAIHLADNGLTKVTGTGTGLAQSKVQLGGTLIQPTTVTTTGQTFKFENATANATKLFEFAPTGVTIHSQSSATSRSQTIWNGTNVSNEVRHDTALGQRSYTEIRSDRFRIGINTGTVSTSSFYDLPLTDGNADQYLKTDGLGNVNWTTLNALTDQAVVIQEFLTSEPIINRVGHSFFIVPPSLNGFQVDSFNWSVFTTGTGTFTMQLERNGTNISGAGVSVAANAQNGSQGFATITLTTNDRIRVITSNATGAVPSGLTIAFDAKKP